MLAREVSDDVMREIVRVLFCYLRKFLCVIKEYIRCLNNKLSCGSVMILRAFSYFALFPVNVESECWQACPYSNAILVSDFPLPPSNNGNLTDRPFRFGGLNGILRFII